MHSKQNRQDHVSTKQVQALRSSLLNDIPHGMFDRYGGCSTAPYDTLNLSFTVGDDPRAVNENRNKACTHLGIKSISSLHQVHGDRILIAEPGQAEEPPLFPQADALISQTPGLGLLLLQADCQGILLYDAKGKSIAAIHNGWRGSVQNIIAKTIIAMEQAFASQAKDIRAVISPSLGPCCAEFVNYKDELLPWMEEFKDERNHFNFWEISKVQLQEAGIRRENIQSMDICTCCNEQYFSHRRAVRRGQATSGRNGSLIALA